MKLQELFDKFQGKDADVESYKIKNKLKPLPPVDGWECKEYDSTVIIIKCKFDKSEV